MMQQKGCSTGFMEACASRRAWFVLLGLVLAAVMAISLAAAPAAAQAADSDNGPALELTTQATTGLASANATTINKAVKSNAKAIVKAAKATTGTALQKLKAIYKYVAMPAKYKGAFKSSSYLSDFYFVASGTANAKFYPATQPKNMSTYYKKYAVDAYKTKKAVCYHYAALFAVAAKQALGSSAVVRIAVGPTNLVGGEWNTHHAWVEVKIGKTTYVYDPMNGHYYCEKVAKKKGQFGQFCGAKKTSSVKKYYQFTKASYCTVKL